MLPTLIQSRELSSEDVVRRALAANAELAAARLEIERARARLRQAGLRPNPSLDLEQVMRDCRDKAGIATAEGKLSNWVAAGLIITIWLLLAILSAALVIRILKA